MQKTFQVGAKTFVLDEAKAEAAFAAKKVINGRESMCFNLLPLKYQWAYDLYRKMKANHWEPEDIPMGKDIEQWRDEKALSEVERWIIRMGIGYFSAAEGIVGDNIQHVVRELVTAPELKLVLGRHAHEENIHADSLLYMIASLGINPQSGTFQTHTGGAALPLTGKTFVITGTLPESRDAVAARIEAAGGKALITGAVLKLFPRPVARATAWVDRGCGRK